MLPLAATAAEKLRETSPWVWLKFGLLLLGFLLAVLILRKIMQVNRFILLLIFVVGGSIVMINWTYHRTEPKILTPLIDEIAPFLPGGKGLDAPDLEKGETGRPTRPKK